MLQNLIFQFFAKDTRLSIWLYETTHMRIEGVILGFDEYMNLTLGDAEEVLVKSGERRPLGRIVLKGENITLMGPADPAAVVA